ncbi:DNA topoisomerase IB [Leifsonia kafniensis]|uniref:DNA topoisomerase n=1 Tax=Leifsonia kafniensis TaxID=475957 RepID=A0ABP7KHE0_9MICO
MTRLRRSNTSRPAFSRVRSGRGFSYRDPDGTTVTDRLLRARFDALVIPPAWTDVWIAPHPNGHIQATGIDDAGRRQRIYHAAWREQRDIAKFDRALDLAAALPPARRRVTRVLRSGGTTRERALAAAFRMLDVGCLRIGSEQYALDYGSRGISTLLCSHASTHEGSVALTFPAKSGQMWQSEIDDADLAAFVRARKRRGPDARLLAWQEGSTWQALSAEEINDYIRERTGGSFTAKDFRTLHGTSAAATSLAKHGPERTQRARTSAIAEAMREAASVLGNTAAIARKSYVDPRIVDLYNAGTTLDLRPGGAPESRLIALLNS